MSDPLCLDCGKTPDAPGVPAICAGWHSRQCLAAHTLTHTLDLDSPETVERLARALRDITGAGDYVGVTDEEWSRRAARILAALREQDTPPAAPLDDPIGELGEMLTGIYQPPPAAVSRCDDDFFCGECDDCLTGEHPENRPKVAPAVPHGDHPRDSYKYDGCPGCEAQP